MLPAQCCLTRHIHITHAPHTHIMHHTCASEATAAAAWALVACAERSPGALKQTARLALSKASTLVAEQLKTATNAVQALRAQELREQVGVAPRLMCCTSCALTSSCMQSF